jgi:hypothetical protein
VLEANSETELEANFETVRSWLRNWVRS